MFVQSLSSHSPDLKHFLLTVDNQLLLAMSFVHECNKKNRYTKHDKLFVNVNEMAKLYKDF